MVLFPTLESPLAILPHKVFFRSPFLLPTCLIEMSKPAFFLRQNPPPPEFPLLGLPLSWRRRDILPSSGGSSPPSIFKSLSSKGSMLSPFFCYAPSNPLALSFFSSRFSHFDPVAIFLSPCGFFPSLGKDRSSAVRSFFFHKAFFTHCYIFLSNAPAFSSARRSPLKPPTLFCFFRTLFLFPKSTGFCELYRGRRHRHLFFLRKSPPAPFAIFLKFFPPGHVFILFRRQRGLLLLLDALDPFLPRSEPIQIVSPPLLKRLPPFRR